jgi:hypothetical protein
VALIVETGAGVANANSYRSAVDAVAYFLARGVTITEAAVEPHMLSAMARMANLDYKGYRVARDQALDFPRSGVCIDGFSYASTELPSHLGNAQLAYAFAARSTTLQPVVATDARGAVIEKTVGPLTTRYATPLPAAARARVPEADSYLAKLLRNSGNSFPITRA